MSKPTKLEDIVPELKKKTTTNGTVINGEDRRLVGLTVSADNTKVQKPVQQGNQSWSENETSKEAKAWYGNAGEGTETGMKQSWTKNKATDKSRAGYGNVDGKTFNDFMK